MPSIGRGIAKWTTLHWWQSFYKSLYLTGTEAVWRRFPTNIYSRWNNPNRLLFYRIFYPRVDIVRCFHYRDKTGMRNNMVKLFTRRDFFAVLTGHKDKRACRVVKDKFKEVFRKHNRLNSAHDSLYKSVITLDGILKDRNISSGCTIVAVFLGVQYYHFLVLGEGHIYTSITKSQWVEEHVNQHLTTNPAEVSNYPSLKLEGGAEPGAPPTIDGDVSVTRGMGFAQIPGGLSAEPECYSLSKFSRIAIVLTNYKLPFSTKALGCLREDRTIRGFGLELVAAGQTRGVHRKDRGLIALSLKPRTGVRGPGLLDGLGLGGVSVGRGMKTSACAGYTQNGAAMMMDENHNLVIPPHADTGLLHRDLDFGPGTIGYQGGGGGMFPVWKGGLLNAPYPPDTSNDKSLGIVPVMMNPYAMPQAQQQYTQS